MNENSYNNEIEVLDGLDGLFDEPEKVVQTTPEPSIPVAKEEEEVLSVLDEPVEEPTFSTFTPDVLVDEEPEPVVKAVMPEVPSINEVFNMAPSVSEPEITEMPVETEVVEEPTQVQQEFGVGFESSPMVEDIHIGPSDLEPVEITPTTEEPIKMEPLPEETVNESVVEEKPDYDINYNFMDDFMDTAQPTIDDAFQFEATTEPEQVVFEEPMVELEPVVEPVPTMEDHSMDLGKTVIIEPVAPKPVEEPVVEEKLEENKNLPVVEETKLVPVDTKKETKKVRKEKKEKKNGRTTLFVILLIVLLLAFAALVPIILEHFAV